jgi:BatD DUF11 like domain
MRAYPNIKTNMLLSRIDKFNTAKVDLGGRLLLFLLIFTPLSIFGQTSFTATTDAKQVPIGEVFEVKFTVENGQIKDFRPPSFGEFNVMSGPNRMNSMTIINGQSKSSETLTYVLQAKKEGVFTIGTAKVNVKGQELTSMPLNVVVTKGKRQTGGAVAASGKDAVFVRAEASTVTAYVGQQIIVDYKLFTRVNLNGVSQVSESDYDGFFKQDVNDYIRSDNRVDIGGKTYLSRIVQRIALFPQREGSLKIDPMVLQAGVVRAGRSSQSNDPFDQFFNMPEVENATLESNALNITVKPLPANVPASFSGAVGDFQAKFEMSKTLGTTDDVIILRGTFTGNGDAKRWQAPKLAAVEGLEFYEPKIINEQSVEGQGEWQTLKEVEYQIVPTRAGNFMVSPEFSWLDTEGGVFKTEKPNFSLIITQGSNKAAGLIRDKVQDILPIKLATVFTNNVSHFHNSTAFWVLLILPFVAFLGVLAYRQWLFQQANRDQKDINRENAPKIAEQRLAVAKSFLDKGNRRLFYEEVSKALFGYVSNKFEMPLAEFSKANARDKLASLNVKPSLVDAFVETLNEAEMAIFAGRDTEGGAAAIYQAALKVIVDIEEDLKL